MRPLSFFTSDDKHDETIKMMQYNDYDIWFKEYKELYAELSLGKKVFFVIENRNSKKNGFVGYLDSVDDLCNPDYIKNSQHEYYDNKIDTVKLKIFDEIYNVDTSWLIETDDTECSNVRKTPIKRDMFGNIVKLNMYAIWSSGRSLSCGTVTRLSDSGAIYVSEFNDGNNDYYEKNIRNPKSELVVFGKDVNIMSMFTKMKLRSK